MVLRIGWALALVLFVSSSWGSPVVRADATLEEAKRVAKQAGVHYQLGRFAEANDAYTKSYELVPTPGLLFNIGQCQMALKSWSRAIFFFEGYLRDKPDAPNAALVRDLEAEAKKEIAAEEAKAADAELARIAATKPPPPPPPPPAPPPPDKRRVPAVALGATSMALLGASLYLGMHSDGLGTAARITTNNTTRSSLSSDKKTFAIAAGVAGGVALAAAVASGVLGYLAWHHAPQIAIAPTPTGAAASFATSF